MRIDVMLAHPIQKLAGHLIQSLLGEQMWVRLEFVERDELHDVCSSVPAVILRVKSLVIAIKSLHRFEICLTDTHNDNSSDPRTISSTVLFMSLITPSVIMTKMWNL